MINYDKLLDDWAEHIHSKADKANLKREFEPTGTCSDGYYKGYADGLIEASAYLTFLEKRKRNKYENGEGL